LQKSVSKGFMWKFFERFGVTGIQFVLQIILARLLSPSHYGVLTIMVIFTTLANVFIQNGFNTALIQNKDVKEQDYSSVFWISLGIAGILYGVIYASAPWIGLFYEMPELVTPLRVLALILFPGALNSIQVAKVSRELDFKKVFWSSVVSVTVAGTAGIALAFLGGGLWALVTQSLLNVFVSCAVMAFTVKLRIRFVCNIKRVRILFSYGWKLLVSSLLDVLYQDLNNLIIGKKYTADDLAFYNRGQQFPQLIINSVNGAVQSVMLPAMSADQDDKKKVKEMTRSSITVSSYVIFPIMAGLAAVAPAMVTCILTEKWLPCVPYLQVCCFTFAFYPIHSSNLQAINAVGRSDIFLKLELVKKAIALALLVGFLVCFDSPFAIAVSGAVGVPLGLFVNAFPNKKLIGYSYFEQMKDILPSFLLSAIMCVAVWTLNLLNIHPLIVLLLQVTVGIALYVTLSALFRLSPFLMLKESLKRMIFKRLRRSL